MRLILADECLNGILVRDLRDAGLSVQWIRESHPGIMDEEVIKLAKRSNQILITEDKDFGEWVFAHKVNGLTIVFLRYDRSEYPDILSSLLKVLSGLDDMEGRSHEFVTISKKKVRRRFI